jgi:hypothetical protein
MLDSYLDLVTSLYRGQPKFMALVAELAGPLVDIQALMEAVRAAFGLSDAIGVQLDAVGLWVGRSRHLETPLSGVYFAWGTASVGWNEGTWREPYDPETGLVRLPDDAYRTLLRARVAANSWDGTGAGADAVWSVLFDGTGFLVVIQDNQDMSVKVGLAGRRPDAVTLALLTGGYLLLKPAAVRVEYYAVSAGGGALFAWDCDSDALAGWGDGAWPTIIIP